MKKRTDYKISQLAAKDIENIAYFTISKFGVQQAEIYKNDLKSILTRLNENPDIGREYIIISDKVILRYRFKAHTIFYYLSVNKLIIVRILSNKMNFLKHLK